MGLADVTRWWAVWWLAGQASRDNETADLQCNANAASNSMDVQHTVAISPIRLLKESFLLSKQSHEVGGVAVKNHHFSSLHLHEISPVRYVQKNCTSANNAYECYLCNKGLLDCLL